MGCLNLLAMMAGRRSSRFYALAFAAAVTLAIEPQHRRGCRLAAQLCRGARDPAARPAAEELPRPILATGALGRALAEGAAMTIAATLTTAPLIAFHFGELSTTTLFANLLAAPAVAPAMWLGMVAAAAGQVPGFPIEAVNWVDALLLAYVAQVAAWCGRPSWAFLHVQLDLTGVLGTYVALAICTVGIVRLRRRSRSPLCDVGSPPTGQKRRPSLPFSARRRSLAFAAGRPSNGPRRHLGPWVAGRERRSGPIGRPAGLGPRRRTGGRDPPAAGESSGGPGRRRAAGRRSLGKAGGRRRGTARGGRSSPTTSAITREESGKCSARCRSGAWPSAS